MKEKIKLKKINEIRLAALKKADRRVDLDYERVSKLYMSIGKIFKKIGFDYKVIETTLYDGRERTILIVNHYGTERPRQLAICKWVQTYKEDFLKKQCLFDASEFIEDVCQKLADYVNEHQNNK
jgi:hypothetical protein